MDAVAEMELFGTLFYVAAAVAGLGLGLAIFFFFFFDIRTVFAFLTGSAKRKTIERMEEQHARTGRLYHQMGHTGETGRTGQTGRFGNTGKIGGSRITHPTPAPQTVETAPIAQSALSETVVFSQDAGETAVLNDDQANLTQVLTPQQNEDQGATTVLTAAPPIRFELTESTVLIHTNEII